MGFSRQGGRGLPAAAPTGKKRRLTGPFGDEDSGAWDFILTDDNVLHRLPVVTHSGPSIADGKGPGKLDWQRIHERGFDGLAAYYRGHIFQIWCLHRTEPDTSQSRCALVFQRVSGTWEALAVGTPDALKQLAGKRAQEMEAEIDRELRTMVAAMVRHGKGRR